MTRTTTTLACITLVTVLVVTASMTEAQPALLINRGLQKPGGMRSLLPGQQMQ